MCNLMFSVLCAMGMWKRILITCFSLVLLLPLVSKSLAYNGICPWANRVWEAFRPSSSKFFMESYMIASWELWNIRNSIIFDNGVPSFNLWRRKFRAQGFLRLVRVSKDKRAFFIHYLEAIT